MRTLIFVLILLVVPLLAQAQQDTTPPVLVEFDFTPKVLDIGTEPADLKFFGRASDSSGVGRFTVTMRRPSRTANFGTGAAADPNGGFEASRLFYTSSELGMWTIRDIILSEIAGAVVGFIRHAVAALTPEEYRASAEEYEANPGADGAAREPADLQGW